MNVKRLANGRINKIKVDVFLKSIIVYKTYMSESDLEILDMMESWAEGDIGDFEFHTCKCLYYKPFRSLSYARYGYVFLSYEYMISQLIKDAVLNATNLDEDNYPGSVATLTRYITMKEMIPDTLVERFKFLVDRGAISKNKLEVIVSRRIDEFYRSFKK